MQPVSEQKLNISSVQNSQLSIALSVGDIHLFQVTPAQERRQMLQATLPAASWPQAAWLLDHGNMASEDLLRCVQRGYLRWSPAKSRLSYAHSWLRCVAVLLTMVGVGYFAWALAHMVWHHQTPMDMHRVGTVVGLGVLLVLMLMWLEHRVMRPHALAVHAHRLVKGKYSIKQIHQELL